MITNPYPTPTDEDDKGTCRFQTYLSGQDKSLLTAIRPDRSTAQAVVNTLIKHLCDDLRELNITSYRADADEILSVLLERRPLRDNAITILRRTSFGTTQEIPTWLQQPQRSAELREGPTSSEVGSNHAKSSPTVRVRRDRKETSSQKGHKGTSGEAKTVS